MLTDSTFIVIMATRIVCQALTRASTVSPQFYSMSRYCFYTNYYAELDLPEYESYDALRRQLLKAITAGSDYFGFA